MGADVATTLRRQWCDVLAEGIERLRGQTGDEELAHAEADVADLDKSQLYWVAEETSLATSAAESLMVAGRGDPRTVRAAGMGQARRGVRLAGPGAAERIPMPVDALCWGVRDGGGGQLRLPHRPRRRQANPRLARLPLPSHRSGCGTSRSRRPPNSRAERCCAAGSVGISLAADGAAAHRRDPHHRRGRRRQKPLGRCGIRRRSAYRALRRPTVTGATAAARAGDGGARQTLVGERALARCPRGTKACVAPPGVDQPLREGRS